MVIEFPKKLGASNLAAFDENGFWKMTLKQKHFVKNMKACFFMILHYCSYIV